MENKGLHFMLLTLSIAFIASAQEQAVFEVRPSPTDEGTTVQACVRLLNVPESAVEVVVNSQENAPSDSATSGVDYAAISTSLQFIQSSAEQCVDISIFEDGALEGIEFFTVSASSNDAVLTPNSRVVVINDATIVEFGFAEPTYTISEGSVNQMVCVNLIDSTIVSPILTITVTLSATQGTATASADYVEPSVSFTFNSNTPPSGECVIINIIDDVIVEDPEMFTLSIEASAGGAISPGLGTAEVTIPDNDGVSVSFDSTELSVVEGNTGMFPSVNVCVSVSPPAGGRERNVLVNLNTQEGSASEDDFQSLNTTLTFMPSTQSMCAPITITGDDRIEPNEIFTVVGSVADALDTFTPPTTATITITDDGDACPGLSSPTNGMVDMSGNTTDSIATYSCESGFMIVGDGERVCQESGQWNGSDPTCESVPETTTEPPVTTTETTAEPVTTTEREPSTEEEEEDGLSTGAIVGIAVGASIGGIIIILIVILLIALLAWCVYKKRSTQKYTLSYSTMYGNSRPHDKPSQPESPPTPTEAGTEERGVDVGDDGGDDD